MQDDLKLVVSGHKLFGEFCEVAGDLLYVGCQSRRVVDVAVAGSHGAVDEQNVRFFHLNIINTGCIVVDTIHDKQLKSVRYTAYGRNLNLITVTTRTVAIKSKRTVSLRCKRAANNHRLLGPIFADLLTAKLLCSPP